jgi:hypothetical protein
MTKHRAEVQPRSWHDVMGFHETHAATCLEHHKRDHDPDPGSIVQWALVAATLANAAATAGIALELQAIRQLLEARASNDTVRMNMTGHVVPKDGGPPMAAGPFNPTDTQDVQLETAPVNAAGAPTTGPFNWTSSDTSKVSLVVSADTKSALAVCAPGVDLDVVVSSSDPRTGVSDTAAIQRTAPPPPDNNSVSINMTGSVVDKAVPTP